MSSQKPKPLMAGQKSIASFFKPSAPSSSLPPAPKAPLQEPAPNRPKLAPAVPHKAPTRLSPPQKEAILVKPEVAEDGGQAAPGAELVGRRLSVFWPLEKAWFEGTIKRFKAEKGKHFVAYDDGDEEWLRLGREKYKLMDEKKGGEPKNPKLGRNAALISDDEGEEEPEEEPEDSDSEWEADGELASDMDEDDGGDDDEEEEDVPLSKKRMKAQQAAAPPAKKNKNSPEGLKDGKADARPSRPLVPPAPSAPPAPSEGRKAAARDALGGHSLVASASPAAPSATAASFVGELAGEAARFAARDAERFQHMLPDNIRDASRRRPQDPGYDPRTLYIPPSWFKQWKVSEGQKQWWDFKAANFDSVLLFKMGKFYELFEMDAHVGAEVLGLSYMRGEQPHCGFPEKNYHRHAEQLARAGHRVVVIEQTETPDLLAKRNAERSKKGLKRDTVVNREAVSVLTRGTLIEPEMLASKPEASYLLAIMEGPNEGDAKLPVRIGFAVADCPTGEVVIGQWCDDDMRSRLRMYLTAFKPVEVVMPAGGVSPESEQCMRICLRDPRLSRDNGGGQEAWDGPSALESLRVKGYYSSAGEPPQLQALADAGPAGEMALGALGGLAKYLAEAQLDRSVLGLGKLQMLQGCGVSQGGDQGPSGDSGPQYVAMDGAALENLEVLENVEGGAAGSLIAALDNCATPCGRRLLRQWLLRPLGRVRDIEERQDAVEDLVTIAADATGEARQLMAGMADLERGIARLQASSCGAGSARDAANVVLYEDQGKRRVASMVAVLKGLKALTASTKCFDSVRGELRSRLLLRLVTPGELFPDMAAELEELEGATDWEAAAKSGKVLPSGRGVDSAYDNAEDTLAQAGADLQSYLTKVKAEVSAALKFASANKDTHLLEIPDDKANKIPRTWELRGTRKGFRRYMNPELQGLVAALEAAEDGIEKAAAGILAGLIERFSANAKLWTAAVSAASQLDALASLAHAAAASPTPTCRPKFVLSDTPLFEAKSLCHPAGLTGHQGCFVPNDVSLGARGAARFMLLTGPNMGGKSTLLRQVSLTALMAQVGAWVPAESVTLSPIDAVFVRMGARDHIMSGQSTFMVELSETASMLRRATPRSLVVLDELGRGTATSDGAAIAAAVLSYVVKDVGCLGMFATHYHRLAEDHRDDPAVAICHMGARIIPSTSKSEPDEVCFLYKLTEGACPKSYGHNVARLAGLPVSVVAQAAVKAAELEAVFRARAAQGEVEEDMPDAGADEGPLEIEKLAAMQSVLCAAGRGSSEMLMAAWRDLSRASG